MNLYSLFQPQAMFVTITKERVVLDFRRRSIFMIILALCLGLGMYLLHVYSPYLEYWQLLCYYVSSLLINNVVSMWNFMVGSLSKSAITLNKCFEVRKCCKLHSTHRSLFVKLQQLRYKVLKRILEFLK
jgi:hypothetical protein